MIYNAQIRQLHISSLHDYANQEIDDFYALINIYKPLTCVPGININLEATGEHTRQGRNEIYEAYFPELADTIGHYI